MSRRREVAVRFPSALEDPNISVRLLSAEETIHSLQKREFIGEELDSCHFWLQEGKEVFRDAVCGILPYDSYDKIWATLNQIRHMFCRIVPREELQALVVEIRAGLSYVTARKCRDEYDKDLNEIEKSLGLSAHHSPTLQNERELRRALERLSRIAADARESHWRKVNLFRKRLFLTSLSLMVLLLMSLVLLPFVLPAGAPSWIEIFLIICFGTMGGLVSALNSRESLESQTSAYYIQRTLLFLRPFIGATAGLIVCLMQATGLISLLPAMATGADSRVFHPAYLVLAFVAGFSERFFITQLEKVSGGARERKDER